MTTIAALWQSIETQYTNGQSLGKITPQKLSKIDEMVYNEDIAYIKQGVELVLGIAPEYLCRYLKLEGESVVLRDVGKFSAPLSAELVLVESAKDESMWQALYENGVFGLMEYNIFEAFNYLGIEDLSESEKGFCVRMAKKMVQISAGEFMMGALEDDKSAYDDERPRHQVTLTRDFLIGKYQVTQALWESVMGSNPSEFKGVNSPVENVSWFDVVEFCNKLSELEGLEPAYTINGENVTCNWSAKGYRLPTEVEWEYAARGGEYHKYSGSNNSDEVAWYSSNSYKGNDRQTHPVGQKKPNGFGLYDMSGNVFEWCWDRVEVDDEFNFVGDSVYRHGLLTDPYGSTVGSRRIFRGGSWNKFPRLARTSYRNNFEPTFRCNHLGFRIGRSLEV